MDPKQEVKQEVEPEQVDTVVAQLIDLVTGTILNEEVREIAKEMIKYRNNLSQKIMEEEEERLDQCIRMNGFPESFKAGWNVWKKNGEDKEKTSYEIFKNFMIHLNYYNHTDQTENQSEP